MSAEDERILEEFSVTTFDSSGILRTTYGYRRRVTQTVYEKLDVELPEDEPPGWCEV